MLYVFFPVYNEGTSAGNLVKRIADTCQGLGLEYHILAVDDGSNDESVAGIRAAGTGKPLTLLEHGTNRGLRQALHTGIHWLVENSKDDDLTVFMDGDDSHDPVHIEAMLERMRAGADVVIASRFRRGAEIHGLSQLRKLLSVGAAAVGAVLFHIRGVRDYTCGYRAIKAAALKKVVARYGESLFEFDNLSFICSVELLVKLATVTNRFAEVAMVLRYDRKEKPSKIRVARMIGGYFRLWARMRATERRANES